MRVIHSIWEAFVSRLQRNVDSDEETRFTPSPLDVSVRVAHGGEDVGVERELSKISDQAAEIERQQRSQ